MITHTQQSQQAAWTPYNLSGERTRRDANPWALIWNCSGKETLLPGIHLALWLKVLFYCWFEAGSLGLVAMQVNNVGLIWWIAKTYLSFLRNTIPWGENEEGVCCCQECLYSGRSRTACLFVSVRVRDDLVEGEVSLCWFYRCCYLGGNLPKAMAFGQASWTWKTWH